MAKKPTGKPKPAPKTKPKAKAKPKSKPKAKTPRIAPLSGGMGSVSIDGFYDNTNTNTVDPANYPHDAVVVVRCHTSGVTNATASATVEGSGVDPMVPLTLEIDIGEDYAFRIRIPANKISDNFSDTVFEAVATNATPDSQNIVT